MNQIERQIVTRLIDDALAAGHSLGVHDGGVTTISYCRRRDPILAALGHTDADTLQIHGVGWVYLVWGNDHDVIADTNASPRIDAIVSGAEALAANLAEAA